MNGIEALWSMPFARPVAWALAHFLWQGALAGLLLAGLLALVDKKNASLRYALAAGTMLVLLTCPSSRPSGWRLLGRETPSRSRYRRLLLPLPPVR